MASVRGKAATMFAGLAEGAAPAFKQILTWVKSIDLAKVGRDLGGVLRAIPAGIQTGRIGELLQLTLSLAFAKGINAFNAGMRVSFAAIGAVLSATFGNLGSIADVLVGAAAQFGAALLNAVQKPLAYVQAFFEDVFDTDNHKRRQRAEDQARGDVNQQFGVRSKNDLVTPFGWFTRTRDQDKRLAEYNTALADRTSQLEKELGAQSIGERAERILREGGPRFGFGGATMNAGEIGAAARLQTQQGLAALRQPMADLALTLAGIARTAKIDDVAGAGGIAAQLKSLVQQLAPPVTPGKGEEGNNGDGRTLAGVGGRLAKIESDRLARVGGFIGGAGGPALDYARRTAVAVEQVVSNTRKLIERPPAEHVPVWGN